MRKVWQLLREETEWLHVRLTLAQFVMSIFPPYVCSRLRVVFLRLAGFRIGHGTVMWGTPTIVGLGNIRKRLTIGQTCVFNVGCHLELGAELVIGDRVSFGQQVMVLTNAHEIGDGRIRRAGMLDARPVRIEDGAWLSTRCTILPGVTIGRGAIVAAGAVVTKSVAPHTMVGGIPAQVIRKLPAEDGQLDAELVSAILADHTTNGVVPDTTDLRITAIDS